nr:MAG: hypothetical protein [Sanya fiers-like virus 52]
MEPSQALELTLFRYSRFLKFYGSTARLQCLVGRRNTTPWLSTKEVFIDYAGHGSVRSDLRLALCLLWGHRVPSIHLPV